ncbi:unnamed protein product [Mesocestoides corti]|uniref:Rho-GAP domain-containing protein n=2 Tax=Mesocestoides corti TaxID=53468 RepID=A0A0R3U2J0_MESCO|nr:unnamed protein product [Mesocestoides corti]
MEKLIRHFNTSPSNVGSLTKKRTNGVSSSTVRCFGVRLDELCARDKQNVPLVITQMCAFLRAVGGFQTEGLFRVNGNSRVIESLRNAADAAMSGNVSNSVDICIAKSDLFLAHLERCGDIHSVASLIKLFLRELPIGLVPPSHTKELLDTYDLHAEDSLAVIERVIRALPPPNFRLLEYLCYFLRQVTQYQNKNKMNSTSLGIVFGPNVFRCPRDYEGLKSQNVVNHIMSVLIDRSDIVFGRKSLKTPSTSVVRKKHAGSSVKTAASCREDAVATANNYRRSANNGPRHHHSHGGHSPYHDSAHAQRVFSANVEAQHNERDRFALSPTEIQSQSAVLEVASGVAEQLSATLQACLRNCVQQHAFPAMYRRSQYPRANSVDPSTCYLSDFTTDLTSVLPSLRVKSPTSHPRTGSSVNSKSRSSVSRPTNIDVRPRQRHDSSSPQIASPPVFNGVTWTGESRAYQSSPNNHIIFQSNDVDTIDSRRSKTVGHVISGRKVSLTRPHEAVILSPSQSDASGIYFASGGRMTDGPVDAIERPQRPPSSSCPSSTQTTVPLKRSGLQDGDTLLQPSTAESPKIDPILGAYHEILQRLAAKRRAANRPDELLDMTLEELEEEKSVIQRTLLSFEKTYGRPRERHERVIMRPVYDRYRSVKRLLASAGNHRCTSPNTPARAFVSNGQDNGTGDLSDEPEPLLLGPPSTTTAGSGCAETVGFVSPKTNSIHSDKSTSAQHANLIRTREGGFVVPEHRVSSVEAHAYPRAQATSTNRCTSLMLSISSQAPDEWFGSLGVSARPSYCLSSPQRYLETEEMAAEQFVEEVTSVQGDLVASEEGNRTPVYQTPSPPQRKPRRKAELPVWVAPSEASGQGKSPAHLPRKSLIISTDPCHQQQQHNRVLSGDDSEDHSISDYISRYSTFTVSQLQAELKFVKESKKSLQKYLKEFEHEFLRNHGRKVDTIGREPLYSEYHKYKMLKVRLTCLERLIEARSGKR